MTAEVVVVGGGLAGTLSAILLGRQGIRTILVDPFSPVPPCFKAEKIEPDQIAYLEEFGLMDALLPHSGTIREVLEAKGGRILKLTRIRQHGVRYHEMVNVVRGHLPPQVDFRVGRVRDVVPGPERQDVRLADGNGIGGRIVLLASGTGGDLATRVGPPRQTIQREQSVCFGFDLARSDGRPFPFESLTYYPEGCQSGVGYLTVFPIRDVMRANLFTFWPQRDPRTAAFVREPAAALARTLPGLTSLVGSLEVLGRAESARIDLFRVEARALGGLVPMADAYQSVCPTTGSGLSKVLTDADVLCHELVPDWLSTPGLGPEKTARWYDHPRKHRVDEKSLRTAAYRRQLSLDPSLGWRLHRARVYSSMWLVGRTDSFRLTRKLTA